MPTSFDKYLDPNLEPLFHTLCRSSSPWMTLIVAFVWLSARALASATICCGPISSAGVVIRSRARKKALAREATNDLRKEKGRR